MSSDTNLPAIMDSLSKATRDRITEWTDQIRLMRVLLEEFGPIDTPAKLTDAADRAKEVHEFIKEIEADRKEAVGPINAIVKQINGIVKPITTEAESLKNLWKSKIVHYQREQRRKAEELERKQREEAERQARLAEEAAGHGDEVAFEHHAQRSEDAEAIASSASRIVAPKTTAPSFGRATSIQRWQYSIVDEQQIPRQYLMVNESALKAAAKQKPKPPAIPGIEWTQVDDARIL